MDTTEEKKGHVCTEHECKEGKCTEGVCVNEEGHTCEGGVCGEKNTEHKCEGCEGMCEECK